MYQLAGNKQALEVLEGMSGWADEWSASKSEEHMQDILNTEYGGMNDVLYNLAAATGEDRWAKAGDRFTKKRFFNPLALTPRRVARPARKYAHPASDRRGAPLRNFRRYAIPRCRRFLLVRSNQRAQLRYGRDQQWRRLAGATAPTGGRAEAQCRYRRVLLRVQHDETDAPPLWLDRRTRAISIITSARCSIIGWAPSIPETGATQYYLSLTPGAWKTFGTEDQSFWCCTGTGVEEYSKLNDSIYWHDADGVFVNLFIPSELNWAEKGFRTAPGDEVPGEPGAPHWW